MTLSERLQAELTSAIRSQDALRRETLRMARAAAYNLEKQSRRALSDDELIGVLAREVKTRRESIEAYTKAGRPELAAKEAAEAGILAEFLPQALDEDELHAMVVAAVDESGAASARELGKVMAILAPRTRGRAEGRTVSELVAQELARRDLAGHGHP